ncbi:pentapeptide repeat-containing protein [Amycolatopsis saalfeldensis]|uniref:pentapeptide repeat-containing protein n=1 Tax=Amycolatopsis saalfeldensis TaxID=394193 RepID=UPI0015A56E91|nr:pentapeptide repeat-containing protein [Amycolatopsis saalfeldensis]
MTAVRHGALYALERVAQGNPPQRQTVVDVICAYLRSPYSPAASGQVRRLGVRRPLLTVRGSRRQTGRTWTANSSVRLATSAADALQEREVRLTAQRILTRHLRPGAHPQHPDDTFWADIDLDLTGATLINFDVSDTQLRTASFNGASFAGNARFFGTSFGRDVEFHGADFAEDAVFEEASFAGEARFVDASFAGAAMFEHAFFAGDALFTRAGFSWRAGFEGASFTGAAFFGGASFAGHARFDGASFAGYAKFDDVHLNSEVSLTDTEFAHGVPERLGPTRT